MEPGPCLRRTRIGSRSQSTDNRPAGGVIPGFGVHIISDDSSAGENPAPVESPVITDEHLVQVPIKPISAGPAAKPFRYDLAAQPTWYFQTFFQQHPRYRDWLDLKSACRLVRSEAEGRRLTKIGRRVKKTLLDRSELGTLGFPKLIPIVRGKLGADSLPMDSFTEEDQKRVVNTFGLADLLMGVARSKAAVYNRYPLVGLCSRTRRTSVGCVTRKVS